jgi:hypothetical protein
MHHKYVTGNEKEISLTERYWRPTHEQNIGTMTFNGFKYISSTAKNQNALMIKMKAGWFEYLEYRSAQNLPPDCPVFKNLKTEYKNSAAFNVHIN